MGFLTDGSTLEWKEAGKLAGEIRAAGVRQFLSIHRTVKERSTDALLWGDEVEYIIVRFDAAQRRVRLSLRSHEILPLLQHDELHGVKPLTALWRPEYGDFMIEGTPGTPYNASAHSLCSVESNMFSRRAQARAVLQPDEAILSVGTFPLLGTDDSTVPQGPVRGPVARSAYLSDNVINHHVRFSTLTRNIRKRRGKKVDIRIPVFLDTNTQPPNNIIDQSSSPSSSSSSSSSTTDSSMFIHMDAMGFGMGCCCLQTTFQCCSITEARQLYDQLAILSPLLMALSASTPIHRGYLSDRDVRWDVISASVDDRTDEETGAAPLQQHRRTIAKSRYASVDSYLFVDDAQLNDIALQMDEGVLQQLLDAGIDAPLARHIAHLFIRDPLVIYADKVQLPDTVADHFENIQSTNWQSVRFKPPPPDSGIGWRVEFRTLEVQLTDFENAAFAVLLVLLTRVITHFDLDMYLPISLVDENMKRAHDRDAVRSQTFYFAHRRRPPVQLSLDRIVNGPDGHDDPDAFPGLVPLVRGYLDSVRTTPEDRHQIDLYLQLVADRAAGRLPTVAKWMRDFVAAHPDYNHDSVVSPQIAHDLLARCAVIGNENQRVPGLSTLSD